MEESNSIKDVNGTEENEEQILPTSDLIEVNANFNKEGNGDVIKDLGLGEILGSKSETSITKVPTNLVMEDNADIFKDSGLGETLGSKSQTSLKEVPNITEGKGEEGRGLTNESGLEVSKDAELYVHEDNVVIPENVINSDILEDVVPSVIEDSGVEISEIIEKELIPDLPVDFQMPMMLTESEIVSDDFLLDQELLKNELKGTDSRPCSKTSALQGIPSEEIRPPSTIEMEKEISSYTVNQIIHVFVEDILNSVQNIVDARETIVTDEFSLSHTSAPSHLEISPPSNSTLSDLEVSQVCCTQEQTRTMELPLRSRIVTAPSLSLENLDPDNPLMRRFQAALNAHLQRQKSRIAGELLEMEGDLRQKKKEREDLSTFLFSTQQALSRQHKSLDKDKGMIMKYFTQRQDIEELLQLEKVKHKEINKLLQAEQRKYANFQLEKDSLSAMISQFSEWETNLNSEITISQLISDKNKADKKLFTEEKLKQDMLLFNLTTEVLHLSSMFTEIEKNIKDKQADLKILTKAVMDGSVDLEALEHENKRLLQVWKVVIFRIQQRDKAFIELKTELVKVQDQFRSLVCQTESYKRSTSGEMKSNENLTETLHRLEFDIDNLERQRLIDEDKQRKMREMLVQTEDMLEITQKDLNSVMVEFAAKDKEIRLLQKEIDKVLSMKYKYEDQILNLLQTRTVNTKAAIQANRRIQQLHQDCRRQEVFKSATENNLAKTILKIEHETKAIKERQIMLDEEEAMEHERDKEIESMELDYNRLIRAIGTKETRVDSINTKVAELVAKTGDAELSPDELLIKHLEKQISENKNNIEDLKILWMREQSHIVTFKQQRSNQLHQLNIYRKQVLIMDQKYLKLDQEIEKYRKDESNMNRGIHTMEQKLASLNEECSQRRGYKDFLENDNFGAQNQLICDLKDAEMASLTILEEMCQLEVDKEDLRKQLIETQREMLAWEKKEELAAETKHNMESAKKEGGEIGVMKTEIHRMEVRCAQLHKVQEKLAQDMEMCVSRRDGIVDLAYAREKRSVKGAHYTRQQFIRKLDDLKSKIRQVNSEIKEIEKSIVTSEDQLKDLNTRVVVEQQQLNGLQDAVINMEAQLIEGHLHRQKNLELLVRRQHKARLYGEVKTGRYAMFIKNESALELESQKQRTINADLISIVESLNTDFPSLDNPLARILNTLRSPAA